MIEKSAGDVWNSSIDLCLKHTCELNSNGTAVESTFREYCYLTCSNVRKSVLLNKNSIAAKKNIFLCFNSNRIMIWFRKRVNAVANVFVSGARSTIKHITLVTCGKVKINVDSSNVLRIT